MTGYGVETPADLITCILPRSPDPALWLPLFLFLPLRSVFFFYLFHAPPFFFFLDRSDIS